jgi:hypothetical protein
MYLESAGGQYLIWDGAAVYIVKGSEYYQSSLAYLSGSDAYNFYAYYDKDESEGGRIRVIVASPAE